MGIKKILLAIDEDIISSLEKKAKETRRSRNNYIEYAMAEYLQFEDKEKQYKETIAELEKQLLIQSIPQQQNNISTETKIEATPIIKEEIKSGFIKNISSDLPDGF